MVSALEQVPPQWKTPEATQMKMTKPGGSGWEEDAKRNEVTTVNIQLPSKWGIRQAFNCSSAIWTKKGDGICGSGGVKCGNPRKEGTSDISGCPTGKGG